MFHGKETEHIRVKGLLARKSQAEDGDVVFVLVKPMEDDVLCANAVYVIGHAE